METKLSLRVALNCIVLANCKDFTPYTSKAFESIDENTIDSLSYCLAGKIYAGVVESKVKSTDYYDIHEFAIKYIKESFEKLPEFNGSNLIQE